MRARPELAYVEHALPGAAAERLALARRLGLGLEVADGDGTDVAAIAASGLRVVTVQATARSLHCWFGAGSLAEIPGRGPRRLSADTRPG